MLIIKRLFHLARSISISPCLIVMIIILVIGVCFRWIGLFNDLWLDEIWTLTAAVSSSSLIELWRAIKWDGFASASTLFLYFVGEQQSSASYRSLSFCSGVLTMIILFLWSRSDRLRGLFLLCLFSFSYLFVLYGSEARGYASMLFFAMLSMLITERIIDQKATLPVLLAYWISTILAFFFHFSFLLFFFALVLWSTAEFLSKQINKTALRNIFLLHLIPATVFMIFYLYYICRLPSAGGSFSSNLDVVISTITVAFGGDVVTANNLELTNLMTTLVMIIASFLLTEIILLWKENNKIYVLYFSAIVLAPAILILLFQPKFIAIRYFLPAAMMMQFVMAGFLARLFRQGVLGGIVSSGLIILFSAANFSYLKDFVGNGRGQYEAALKYMATSDSNDVIEISGDHNFRNKTVLEYYQNVVFPKKIEYVDVLNTQKHKVEWFLIHTEDRQELPKPFYAHPAGPRFYFEKAFPHTALSGWTWFLYRRHTAFGNETKNEL